MKILIFYLQILLKNSMNKILSYTLLTALFIIYHFGILTYLILGYIFLIEDYQTAHECKSSNLWEYVLVLVIISTISIIKLFIKGYEFKEISKELNNFIIITCIILLLLEAGFISWSGVELFKNSCNDLKNTRLWTYALVSFSFHCFWFCASIIILLNYKKVSSFVSENINDDDDRVTEERTQTRHNLEDRTYRQTLNNLEDLITRHNSTNVQASTLTEIDPSQINVTPTAEVRIEQNNETIV